LQKANNHRGGRGGLYSLDVDPIEIVRLDQLNAIIREVNTRSRIRGQRREEVAKRPSAYGRVHLDAIGVCLLNQSRLDIVCRARRWLTRLVPRAIERIGRGWIPILLPEQYVRIRPRVGAPYFALRVGLEEGEVVSSYLGVIEIVGLCLLVAVVPLPFFWGGGRGGKGRDGGKEGREIAIFKGGRSRDVRKKDEWIRGGHCAWGEGDGGRTGQSAVIP
jgi:hypothetical protein